ncbi:MAG: site-specific recombinase [Patescibacteria group bacterium]|nr:site-specific recombinase [Patescibacteria group bacterium]
MNKLRYIGYVRKSTEDEERQVLSKEAQRDKIRERFGDLNIIDIVDESKSASEPDKRPVFASILKMIDEGKIDGIIAWHPDRLSRNEIDASSITYRIRKGSIKDLKFASFTFDNSPEGIMMLQMTLSQSQYFSSKLSKDVKRGNETKRKNGGLTGVAPQGYLNDLITKRVIKDPVRFPLVRKAFDLFLTGEHSVQDILHTMNNDWKYRTVERSKSGNKPLSRSTLYQIFRNVRYAGLVPDPYDQYRFYPAEFPAMITQDEYDKVQSLLGTRSYPHLARRKEFALRGFIRCGECGCMITAQTKTKKLKNGGETVHRYYHCTGKRGGCSQVKIYGYKKEDKLYDELNVLLDRYELTPQLEDWTIQSFREMADEENKNRKSVNIMQSTTADSIESQLDNLLDMASKKLIDNYEYERKSKQLKAELKEIHKDQSDTANRAENWYDFAIKTFERLTNANENFVAGGILDKKHILLSIGQNPILYEGKLQITPFEWLEPVRLNVKSIRAQLDEVRTMPQRIQKASEEAVRLNWQGHVESNHDPRFWRPMY